MTKTCYIISAGDIDEKGGITPDEDDLIICADGGYKNRLFLGREPDLVMGDFDSLGYIPKTENKIIAPAEKDFTDTHLAVEEGMKRGFKNFVIFGALGGARPEHSIANLQLLKFIASCGYRGTILHMGKAFTAFKNSSLNFNENREGYVSVFSLSDESRGVTIKNLKFEVENFNLRNDVTLGVSNEFVGKESSVSVRDGILLVVYDR